MRVFRTHIVVLAVVLWGCSDPPQRNNGNVNNSENNSNNATNNATNNGIVGVDCTSNEDCAAPMPTCMGDVSTSYSGPGFCQEEFGICNFTFVQESADCSVTRQSCEAGTCVDNACTNLDCTAPDDFCMGNILHFYPEDGTCDLATAACVQNEFTLDCVEEGGECVDRTCIGACVGVECDMPPADSCMGNVAVTYPAEGQCVQADGSCDYESDKVMTDCTADSKVCIGGACVTDPCEGVLCPQLPDACDMNMTYIYSGDGTCDQATGMCDYSLVEAITDCAAETCINAVCVNTTPALGELVVTEVMHSPVAVGTALGAWFEITNVSTRPLELEGLNLESDTAETYTLALGQSTLLAPGDYFVLGINDDMATNGGIAVDAMYANLTLTAMDSLTILVGTTTVDTVAWDTTNGWPATAGAAMQFGSNYDPAADDNSMANFWCDATNALPSTDLGTPGAVNGTCP